MATTLTISSTCLEISFFLPSTIHHPPFFPSSSLLRTILSVRLSTKPDRTDPTRPYPYPYPYPYLFMYYPLSSSPFHVIVSHTHTHISAVRPQAFCGLSLVAHLPKMNGESQSPKRWNYITHQPSPIPTPAHGIRPTPARWLDAFPTAGARRAG